MNKRYAFVTLLVISAGCFFAMQAATDACNRALSLAENECNRAHRGVATYPNGAKAEQCCNKDSDCALMFCWVAYAEATVKCNDGVILSAKRTRSGDYGPLITPQYCGL